MQDEVCPGSNIELPEDLVQVILHGAAAEEELSGDLGVASAVADEIDDLQLLGGQLLGRVHRAAADCLAGGAQLGPGPIGPGGYAEPIEGLQSGA